MFSLDILIADIFVCIDSINVNENNEVVQEKEALLIVESLGHAALVFVNKRLVGGNSNRCKETLFSFFMCYFFLMVAKSLLLVIHLKFKLILL